MTIRFMLGNHSQGKFWPIGEWTSHQVRLQHPYVWVKTDKPLTSGKWYWEAVYLSSNDKKNMHIGATALESGVYEAPVFNILGDGYFGLYDRFFSTDSQATGKEFIDGKKIPPQVGDVYTFALDLDASTIAVGRNGPAVDKHNLRFPIANKMTITPSASIYASGMGELFVQFIFGSTSSKSFRYPIPLGYTSYDETMSNIPIPKITKHLFKDSEGYKKYDASTWSLVSATLPTKTQFQTQGMNDMPNLEAVKALTHPEIYTYTTIDEDFQLQTTFIPQEKIIFPKTDLSLYTVKSIQNVKLTAAGQIKIIMSNDTGITWYGLPNEVVDHMDLADVKEKGLTAEQLAALTEAEWTAFLGKEKKLRFAYLFYPDLSTDIDHAEVLELIVNIKGSSKKAMHLLDYDYDYFAEDRLRVIVKTNGDYLINCVK